MADSKRIPVQQKKCLYISLKGLKNSHSPNAISCGNFSSKRVDILLVQYLTKEICFLYA